MVLIVLVVLWSIVLVPPAWQSHAEARRARLGGPRPGGGQLRRLPGRSAAAQEAGRRAAGQGPLLPGRDARRPGSGGGGRRPGRRPLTGGSQIAGGSRP